MRSLSAFEQEDRKRKLLHAIIHEFIKTGKPVGSVFLAEQYKLDLSSATIRNVMADLEQEGFLTHPHTSAGRVPTDKAYRFYVDSLVDLQRLAQMEEEKIKADYEARIREIEGLLAYTGFVMTPSLEETRLRHLELVPLDSLRVLVILVSDTGIVRQKVVLFDRPLSPDTLSSMARVLNEKLRGRSFNEVRDRILDHLDAVHQQQQDILELARQITREAFAEADPQTLYVEGAGNILSLPDFQDQEQMRTIIQLLDEKRALGELLDKDLRDDDASDKWKGVRVKIGAENKMPNLKDVSMVSSVYTIGDRKVGVLGIIGPKRMEYSRMISLVGHMARTVSGALSRMLGKSE
jgi:heat-inducible transcriptional repressor